MPVIRIPTPLRAYADGQSQVQVSGQTASEALQALVQRYPALQPHLFATDGTLRPFVNLFLHGTNLRDMEGLNTPLQAEDTLMIIPSIAGGRTP